MVTQSWLYDAILYIYALSLLFYFSDFAHPNRSAKRMGTGLLSFVWILQTAYLIYGLVTHEEVAAFSRFETLFMFSWLLVTVSLAVNRFFRIELFVFLVNVFGFAILALNFFSNPNVSPTLAHWNITDELLFIHISLSLVSYVAFVISVVFSGMYLFLHRKLKERQWSQRDAPYAEPREDGPVCLSGGCGRGSSAVNGHVAWRRVAGAGGRGRFVF